MYRLILLFTSVLMAACSLAAVPDNATTEEITPPFTLVAPTATQADRVALTSNTSSVSVAQAVTPLPTIVPTVAISQPIPPTVPPVQIPTYAPVDPGVRAFALSASGGLRWGEIELPGDARYIDYNPVYPASYARVDSHGLLHFVPPPSGSEGVYTFSPYFEGYSVGSPQDNRLFVTEAKWSPNGQMLAFRIGDNPAVDSNAGIWFWQPARDMATDPSYHLLRDCPPGCDLVTRVNADEWRSLSFDWSADNQAILIHLTLPTENRRGLAVVQAVRDPETRQSRTGPTVLRYDYGSWSNDGQRIIVSGKNPDGQVVFGSIARDGSSPILTAASSIGLAWVQNAVQQPVTGQIIMLGAAGGSGSALRLYDSTGKALTENIGSGAPARVSWSLDRNAVLVVVDEVNTSRYYVAQVNGTIQEITADVAGTQAMNWVAGNLPPSARTRQSYVPTGVIAGSQYQPGQQLRVYVDQLTIYSSPSLQASQIGTITKGEYVAILAGPAQADDVTWWRVQTVQQTGWIGGQINDLVTLGP